MTYLILTWGGDVLNYFIVGERAWHGLEAVWGVTMGRYLKGLDTKWLQSLTPGEQYRKHVSAGGYRP